LASPKDRWRACSTCPFRAWHAVCYLRGVGMPERNGRACAQGGAEHTSEPDELEHNDQACAQGASSGRGTLASSLKGADYTIWNRNGQVQFRQAPKESCVWLFTLDSFCSDIVVLRCATPVGGIEKLAC
jgi:hypothetical protein